MKFRLAVAVLAIAPLSLAPLDQARADTLFVADMYGPQGVHTIDTNTAAQTAVGSVGSGYYPLGMSFDPSGNHPGSFFTADWGRGEIGQYSPNGLGGYTRTVYASGLSRNFGIAFDKSGNLYTSEQFNNDIVKIDPLGTKTVFASGAQFNQPTALAIDPSGNLFVANFGGLNNVVKITPGGATSVYASGFAAPDGLAFDSQGNLFVANDFGASVSKVTPGGTISTFWSGASLPHALAVDSADNLYVGNEGTNTIAKITPAGVATVLADNVGDPNAMAFDTGATATPAPEPASMLTLGAALAGLGILRRRRKA